MGWPVLAACSVLSLAACDLEPDSAAAAASASAATRPGRFACDIALATQESPGDGAAGGLERRIADYQRTLKAAAGLALPQLERLGWAYVAKARASLDPGYYNLALQTADCIEAQAADAPEGLLLRGHALHNLHRFAEAGTVAKRLVAVRGRWFDQGLLGDALLELGRFDEAVHAYQAMLDERPGPEAYARAARVRWLVGDLLGAEAMMAAAVRAMGGREREPLVWSLVQLGKYRSLLDPAAAWSDIERALQIWPLYPPALLERGRRLLADGRSAEAVPTLRRAAALDPLPETHWVLLEALEQSHAAAEAADIAARLSDAGARQDPRTVALFLATRGQQPERALQLSTEELAVRQDIYTLDAHAWALLAAGRVGEALEFSRRALALGTRDARLFYHAGVIRARAGDAAWARHWLRRARELEVQLLPSERRAVDDELAALEPLSPPRMANIAPPGNSH